MSTDSTIPAFSGEPEVYKKGTETRCLFCGAKDGVRTRDLDLGKVALYQLSYFRIYSVLDTRRRFDDAKVGQRRLFVKAGAQKNLDPFWLMEAKWLVISQLMPYNLVH